MVRIQVIKSACPQPWGWSYNLQVQLPYTGIPWCAKPRFRPRGSGLGRQIRSRTARAEDQVDEHHGMETSALAAQASVVGVVLLPAGGRGARLMQSDKSALYLTEKILGIGPGFLHLGRIAAVFQTDFLQDDLNRVFRLESTHD
jgi:hypothetical protein